MYEYVYFVVCERMRVSVYVCCVCECVYVCVYELLCVCVYTWGGVCGWVSVWECECVKREKMCVTVTSA